MKQSTFHVAMLGALAVSCVAATAHAQTIPNTAAGWTTAYGNRTDGVWDGADQGSSIKASNGVIYFVHGDTFTSSEILTGSSNRGAYSGLSNSGFVGNSIVRLVNNGGTTMVAPATSTTEAVPPLNSGMRFWAMDLFQANGNNIYVLLQAVQNSSSIVLEGAYLQKFAINSDGTLTRTGSPIPLPNAGTVQGSNEGPSYIQWARAGINFFGAIIIYGDGNKSANSSGHEAYVMQVPQASLDTLNANNYSAVEFWNSSFGYVSGLSEEVNATPILNEMIDSARIIDSMWVVSYKELEGFANNDVTIKKGTNEHDLTTLHATVSGTSSPIVSSTHSAVKCGQPPAFPSVPFLTYAPIMHPEITLSNGRMLMSIAWNTSQSGTFWHDAELYRLRFFDVAMP